MPRNGPSIPAHLHRFVRSLHARFVLVRGAERVGACVLVASAAAIALVPIILWRGGAAPLPAVLMLLGFGLSIGILLGILRRPSRMDAAAEADRQLRLADLIGT